MLTIYRNGLTITSGGPLEPSEGSYNIPVNLINDDTYTDYVISMYVGYRIKGIQRNKRIEKDSNENYLIPAEAFAQAGPLFISFLLEKEDSTQGAMTNALSYNIKDAPYNNIVLSDDPTWKEEVKAWVEELCAGINGGSGLSDEVKFAILDCFKNVAWAVENGSDYYNSLYNLLINISFTQSDTTLTMNGVRTVNSIEQNGTELVLS